MAGQARSRCRIALRAVMLRQHWRVRIQSARTSNCTAIVLDLCISEGRAAPASPPTKPCRFRVAGRLLAEACDIAFLFLLELFEFVFHPADFCLTGPVAFFQRLLFRRRPVGYFKAVKATLRERNEGTA